MAFFRRCGDTVFSFKIQRAVLGYIKFRYGTPPGDTKDMYITGDGQYLYNLGAYQTFTVSKFDVAQNGTLDFEAEYSVAAATEKGPGAYNFLGLTGFDK